MIPTTLAGEEVFLWSPSPRYSGSNAFQARVSFLSEESKTRTRLRMGVPLSRSLRIDRISFSCTFSEEGVRPKEVSDFLLLEHRRQRIGVPFWPFARPLSEYPSFPAKAKWSVTFEPGFSAWEVHLASSPAGSFTSRALTAPLILCRWEKRPKLSMTTDELGTMPVTLFEDSEAEEGLIFSGISFDDGPELEDESVFKVFPFLHDYSSSQETGSSELAVDYTDPMGQGRRYGSTDDGGFADREIELSIRFSGDSDGAKLLSFFQQMAGTSIPFWTPSGISGSRMTSGVSSASASFSVEDGAEFSGHEWAYVRSGRRLKVGKILSVESGLVTLDSPVGFDAPAKTSTAGALVLGRFARSVLSVSWRTDRAGNCRAYVEEVSAEYEPDEAETRGDTIGSAALPRCSLYVFRYGEQEWRYTSFESALTVGEDTFVRAGSNITHSAIFRGILMESECSVSCDLRQIVPMKMLCERDLRHLDLDIYIAKAQADGEAIDLVLVQTGRIGIPKVKELVKASAPCLFMGDARERRLPRLQHSWDCKHQHYGEHGCKLVRSENTYVGEFQSVGTAGWPFEFVVENIARLSGADPLPSFLSNRLAGGRIWVGDGVGRKSQLVAASTAISGGTITFTTGGDFFPFPEDGDPVYFTPSCDGQISTCKWFNNYDNFGGVKAAKSNLSLVKIENTASTGKK